MILNYDQLPQLVATWHDQQRKVVLTNGCYDLLHLGHLQSLNEAKKLGDLLVVGVNSDHSVQLLKGPNRPIIPQDQRSALVAALKPVDYVILFDEQTATNLLEEIKPQVYAKGGDYDLANLPEREVLNRLGIEVVFIPILENVSTTLIIKQIQAEIT